MGESWVPGGTSGLRQDARLHQLDLDLEIIQSRREEGWRGYVGVPRIVYAPGDILLKIEQQKQAFSPDLSFARRKSQIQGFQGPGRKRSDRNLV